MSIADNPVSQLPVLDSPPAMSNVFPVVNDGQLKRVSYANIVGSWTSYTPTFTNFTLGDGTINSIYMRTGNIVHWHCSVTLGSTSVVSGRIDLSLPFNVLGALLLGNATIIDSGVAIYSSSVRPTSVSTLSLYALNAPGSYLQIVNTGATVPFTWGTGDSFAFLYAYRIS